MQITYLFKVQLDSESYSEDVRSTKGIVSVDGNPAAV